MTASNFAANLLKQMHAGWIQVVTLALTIKQLQYRTDTQVAYS